MFMYVAFQSVHGPLEVERRYSELYPDVEDGDRRTYLGMVTAMDDAVGAIVRELKAANMYHDTIIIFSSDVGQLVTAPNGRL